MLRVVVRNDDSVLNNDVLEQVGAGSREVFGSCTLKFEIDIRTTELS